MKQNRNEDIYLNTANTFMRVAGLALSERSEFARPSVFLLRFLWRLTKNEDARAAFQGRESILLK